MKIIWGINIPYIGEKATWPGVEENRPNFGSGIEPVWVPCVRIHKEMCFQICDVCGETISYGRISRGITTCCPKCNAKKWDIKNGLVIEKERNANGVRPASFWNTISWECFERDNHTCQHCHKTRRELNELKQTEHMIGDRYTGKYNRNYKPTDYILNCHHIKPIKDGGNNKLENLITLCGKCHKAEHSRVGNIKRVHHPLVTE